MIRRPRLALPFTALTAPGVVRLVAGEDVRYTLEAPGLDAWLPGLLAVLDGSRRLDDAVAALPEAVRADARELLARLEGERVLIEGDVAQGHAPGPLRLALEGAGRVHDLLAARPQGAGAQLRVLCQDRLDHAAAVDFSARCRRAGLPHLWVTHGPLARAFVGPALLPDAGPCLGCLISRFRTLSPAPEVHDALLEHARAGRPITPVDAPPAAAEVLAALVTWKAEALALPAPPSALFRLHVLELDTFEVSTHRVFVDPECPVCRP